MKVAVLGSTGSTGSQVVDVLLSRGHEVVAVSRSTMRDRASQVRLTSHVGDLSNVVFLRGAIAGCDALISCLGQSRASKNLFSRRTSPPDILCRIARATIAAIGEGPQHFIYMSAFGVGADRHRHALLFRVIHVRLAFPARVSTRPLLDHHADLAGHHRVAERNNP